MASSCFTDNCGCGNARNGYSSSCGCENTNNSSCGCDNGNVVTNNCGCGNTRNSSCGRNNGCGNGQNLLGCALGGLSDTVYKVINGLDNTLCGCGCRRF